MMKKPVGRPLRHATTTQRIRVSDHIVIKRQARLKRMTIPDYINWRLRNNE